MTLTQRTTTQLEEQVTVSKTCPQRPTRQKGVQPKQYHEVPTKHWRIVQNKLVQNWKINPLHIKWLRIKWSNDQFTPREKRSIRRFEYCWVHRVGPTKYRLHLFRDVRDEELTQCRFLPCDHPQCRCFHHLWEPGNSGTEAKRRIAINHRPQNKQPCMQRAHSAHLKCAKWEN